jgi:hypothetical protein
LSAAWSRTSAADCCICKAEARDNVSIHYTHAVCTVGCPWMHAHDVNASTVAQAVSANELQCDSSLPHPPSGGLCGHSQRPAWTKQGL